ncbi:hypothetical protein EVAR_66527_1 [Eumeta japonica]|uniref:Uncharacterized protein n=1 Tax=Eumeta variegata TaxID=151549 RepID=A0A4C1ZBQ8_EUMVA|nr:hypothetical protein EVAR_66527_1 [Eumeta japonica]
MEGKELWSFFARQNLRSRNPQMSQSKLHSSASGVGYYQARLLAEPITTGGERSSWDTKWKTNVLLKGRQARGDVRRDNECELSGDRRRRRRRGRCARADRCSDHAPYNIRSSKLHC